MADLRLVNPRAAATQAQTQVQFRIDDTMSMNNTPAHAASSFIRNIRYRPGVTGNGVSFVRLGKNLYWYPMTMRRLSNWLNSRSLGQYYNRYIKLK